MSAFTAALIFTRSARFIARMSEAKIWDHSNIAEALAEFWFADDGIAELGQRKVV